MFTWEFSIPWDWVKIGAKLGAKHVIYQKLENFLLKKHIYAKTLERVIFGMQVCILQTRTQYKRKTPWNWVLKVGHNFGSEHVIRQMDPYFSFTLWYLPASIFHFSISRPSKFNFMGPSFCIIFWSAKCTFTCQKSYFQSCWHKYPFLHKNYSAPNLIPSWTQSHKVFLPVWRDEYITWFYFDIWVPKNVNIAAFRNAVLLIFLNNARSFSLDISVIKYLLKIHKNRLKDLATAMNLRKCNLYFQKLTRIKQHLLQVILRSGDWKQ